MVWEHDRTDHSRFMFNNKQKQPTSTDLMVPEHDRTDHADFMFNIKQK